ncbi:MAG TPA: condensation domain-containing protein, partial [Candidatus Sulfopaludibacter sp.]|nr:condensation domain-containing protein [Candidatus Sulfopaludibacter sp.]
MTVTELLSELVRKGLQVTVDGGQLKLRGPKDALTPELLRSLAERKAEIVGAFEKSKGRAGNGGESIPRVSRTEDLPLSEVQQELWLVEQLAAGSVTRRVTAGFALRGELDTAALTRSLRRVVERHEALRTTFAVKNGRPVQVVHADARVELPVVDLEQLPTCKREPGLRELLIEQGSRRFDLENGPLFRVLLIRKSATDHILYLTAHHLIFDVESVWLFLREVADGYGHGSAAASKELPVQYGDFAAWQRGRSAEAGERYWKQQLAHAPAVLDLAPDRMRGLERNIRCRRQRMTLSKELSEGLSQCSRREGVTPFVLLFSAFSVLLGRYAGRQDVLVGSPVSGRTQPETEALIGSFAYPMVLRADLSGECTFRELLRRVRENTMAAFEHQDVPFGRVLELAQPERRAGYSPLFQVMFTHPPSQAAIEAGGVNWEPLHELLEATVEYDLFLSAMNGAEGLELSLTWPDDLFEAATIERMFRHLRNLLAAAVENAGLPLSALPMLDGAERYAAADVARVEAALRTAPAVSDCAVLAREAGGVSHLVAYVAPGGHFSAGEIRGHLEKLLPEKLVPATLVAVSHLPLTAAGAVDAAALSGLAAVDGALAETVQASLQAQAGAGGVVVDHHETVVEEAPLHISDLLAFAGDGQAAARPEEAAGIAEDVPERPMAVSDGGPLAIPADAPRTLTEALLRTAARYPRKGITYVDAHGGVVRQTYAALLEDAKRILAGLRAHGFRPGDRVMLQISTLRDHFSAFWGCVLGGIVPVTVAVAPSYLEKSGVVNKLFNTWKLLEHPAILCGGELRPAIEGLSGILPMAEARVLAVESLKEHGVAEEIYECTPDDLIFFQLSSGSTGTPKCIQERHRGIVAHVHGAQQFNGYSADDVNLNWLPVDHVVPILTCHLKDVYLGCEEIQVKAEAVLSAPTKWLDLIETYRVTHTWAPNFGFKLVADSLRSNSQRKWDLSSMKFFMNAGEQVTMPVVRDFLAAVAPFGVRASAMQPSFGMAEACTCMTFLNGFDMEKGCRRILKSSLGGALQVRDREDEGTMSFVDLGPPVPGVSIRITDGSNQVRPEGYIGRFQIRGDVITPGYLNN